MTKTGTKTAEADARAVEAFVAECAGRVGGDIERQLEKHRDGELAKAVLYAGAGEGKRIRPAIIYAAAQAAGLDFRRVDGIACAVELIHCYSLIHDDLPAMDDDDLRRGKPACHKVFGEALAILAGDAMQALAFERLAGDAHLDAAQKVETMHILAATSGLSGMACGQALDIRAAGSQPDIAHLEHIHRLKTGTLMSACVTMTLACAGGAPDAVQTGLRAWAADIGLCFQIRDDILDVESATAALGKPHGSDRRHGKPTYVALLGPERARRELEQLGARCLQQLADAGGGCAMLRGITRCIAGWGL